MPLTEDQKKLLVGGGVGALALAAGYLLFSGRQAMAAPGQRHFPSPSQQVPPRGDHKRKKRHHDDEGERSDRDRSDHGDSDHGDNGRGEYGRKKKHKRHSHGD